MFGSQNQNLEMPKLAVGINFHIYTLITVSDPENQGHINDAVFSNNSNRFIHFESTHKYANKKRICITSASNFGDHNLMAIAVGTAHGAILVLLEPFTNALQAVHMTTLDERESVLTRCHRVLLEANRATAKKAN